MECFMNLFYLSIMNEAGCWMKIKSTTPSGIVLRELVQETAAMNEETGTWSISGKYASNL